MKTSLICCGVFFAENCHCVRIALKVSQQSVASIINKQCKILINRLYVGTAVHSGIQRHHWGIGLAGYTFTSSIQARAIAPPSSGSAPPVTTGSLWSLQWASPPSTLQKRPLPALFIGCFLRFRSKKVLLYLNFTFVDINSEQSHNVATSHRCNIEKEGDKNLKPGQSTFCRKGGVPIKYCEIAIFLHFHVYIYEDFLYLHNIATSIRLEIKISRWVNRHSVDQEVSM